MNKRLMFLAIAAFVSPLAIQQAAAQTTLPGNVQADQATITQDKQTLQNLRTQFRADQTAGNTAAAAADRTAMRLAHMQLAEDIGQLHKDAQPILQPDVAALKSALTQLHSDQVANNASAVASDQAAVEAAETQLQNDRIAVFGAVHGGHGPRHMHMRGG